MTTYVTPNDKGIMGRSDSESIQNAVNYAVESGLCKVIIQLFSVRRAQSDDRAVNRRADNVFYSYVVNIRCFTLNRKADNVITVFFEHSTTDRA